MSDYKYDYVLDKNGPKGVSVESWLENNKLALIIIDIQNYITNRKYRGKYSSDGADDYYYNRLENTVLPNILKIIKRFREHGIKIVYTRIASQSKRLEDVPGLGRKYLADKNNLDEDGKRWTLYCDEHSSEVDKRIEPLPEDIVIMKTGSGAFSSSEIDLILRNNNISRLVFTGGLTDACISSTVRGAFDRGYLCTIVEDACITSTEVDHEAALRSLDKFYGWVTSTEDLLSRLYK